MSAVGKGKRRLPPPIDVFKGIVTHKIVSVGSKIVFVLRKLLKNKSGTFKSFFTSSESKSEMVATFLAMLELVKAKRISVTGDIENPEVRLIRKPEEAVVLENK